MTAPSKPEIRLSTSPDELAGLQPLWDALQVHQSKIAPDLGAEVPSRDLLDSWRVRRAKYEHWLESADAFFAIAELDGEVVGYAFVTIGLGYASWSTGEQLADLQTISVLPPFRNSGVGADLLEAVWKRLEEQGVQDLQIMTVVSNVDSHRFYERHGFEKLFVVYHGRRRPPS
jgi:ribosomal protein S18 acetylase RimI-like enzyme